MARGRPAVIDPSFVLETVQALARGVPLTLSLAASSLVLGFGLAVLLTVARRSGVTLLAWLARAYVFVFRGSPLLVQIYLIYYGPGQFEAVRRSIVWDVLRQPYWCALIALTLVTAAYGSEIIRGGLDGVPHGLVEAGQAFGLSRFQIVRLIVVPLALRHALPAYGNEAVVMVKATSLASVITLMDITGIAYRLIAETYQVTTVFVIAGALYLAINALVIGGFDLAERRLGRYRGTSRRAMR